MNDKILGGLGPEVIFRPESFYEDANNNTDQDEPVNENSYADEPVDYATYIQGDAFAGEYPFDTIIEGIRNQFSNYIATEDRTNYVEAFYNQYHTSYELAETENFTDDIKEVLDNYLDKFLALLKTLFYNKLTITITELEGEEKDASSIEICIKKLYEFFIINAKKNFMSAIVKSCYKEIDPNLDDRAYYARIQEVLTNYSPLVLAIGPNEFLRYCGDEDIVEIFNSGRAVGNFLRKYSPRLYQNEEFECDIVAEITSVIELHKEAQNLTNGDE